MRCLTEKCEGKPRNTVWWPGKEPAPMCDACAYKAQAVGAAMGFRVPCEPIPSAEEVQVAAPARKISMFGAALLLECGHVLVILDGEDKLMAMGRPPDEASCCVCGFRALHETATVGRKPPTPDTIRAAWLVTGEGVNLTVEPGASPEPEPGEVPC